MQSNHGYLIRLLREEVAQAQAEVESIRKSLRYRLGSVLVEVLPPSKRSIAAVREIWQLLSYSKRTWRKGISSGSAVVPDVALKASVLVFASSSGQGVEPTSPDTWGTTDPALMALVIDATDTPRVLRLQQLDQIVVRRLARWQLLGGRIEWQPVPYKTYDPVLYGYVMALLDKPLVPCL